MDAFGKPEHLEPDVAIDIGDTDVNLGSHVDPDVHSPFVLVEHSLEADHVIMIFIVL